MSILFGVTIRVDGEVIFDEQKATNNPNVVECTIPAEPGTEITVRVINTPPHG